ncbi:MAG: CPBP family intramembrane glutamic endopeptidase [Halobacteriales archaeon]|nr:CPBP family intramembrane glutamic endopeptidase [Halobacteriales archaeon]
MTPRTAPPSGSLDERPAWQLLGLAAGVVVWTLAVVVLVVTVASITAPLSPLGGRAHTAAVGLPVVLALYESVRRLLGLPAAWFRADRPSRRLAVWLPVGLAFPTVVLGGQLWLLDAASLGPPPALAAAGKVLAAALAAGLLAGVLEELALRGALLRLLEVRWGPRAAIAGSAAVFALLHQGHAGSPGALAAVLASMGAAGLLLGVVAVRSGSVWPAVWLHAGWNTVFGGGVVAAAPPGRPLEAALLQFRLPTESLLTGGTASLAAAPLTTAALLLATLAAARVPRRWLARDPNREPGARAVR